MDSRRRAQGRTQPPACQEGGRLRRPRRDLNARPFAPQANALSKLSYEGEHATLRASPAGREGFEPSVEALQPLQALSRRPRSATPAPPHAGTTWPRWVLSPRPSRPAVSGGGRGIRTPGGLPHSCFQDSRLRPLGHPSGHEGSPTIATHSTMRPRWCQSWRPEGASRPRSGDHTAYSPRRPPCPSDSNRSTQRYPVCRARSSSSPGSKAWT